MQMQQIMMAVGVHQRTPQFVVRFLSRALSLPLSLFSLSLSPGHPPLSHTISLSLPRTCALSQTTTRATSTLYRSSDVKGREADKKERTPPQADKNSAHHHLLLVKVLAWHPAEEPARSGKASTLVSKFQSKPSRPGVRHQRDHTHIRCYANLYCEASVWHKLSFPPFLDSPPVSVTEPVGSYTAPP
jgi:hypothetical protein